MNVRAAIGRSAAKAIWFTIALLAGGLLRADFCVSPAGLDSNDGSLAAPFQSLERARSAVRQAIATDGIPEKGLTIWLRQGDYIRERALELGADDSGVEGRPVTWRAYENERVRLLGGRVLTGFVPVEDAQTLARLDASARAHVLQVDLRELGIGDFGELKSRGFGRPTVPAHCELFFADHPMTLARWPNEGNWGTIQGYPSDAAKIDEHSGQLGELTGGFFFEGDRPRRWQAAEDLWVHGYWAYDWANSYERVAKLEAQRRFVQTAEPYGHYGFRTGQRFYFLNVLEELDQPGEWFLDRKSKTLYFWPPSSIGDGQAVLSVLAEPLVRINEARYVTLHGLALEATRGSGVEISGGDSNCLVGLRLRNLGNWGVTITGGVNHSVASCDILDTGDGGVAMTGGDRQSLAPGGHETSNCRFVRQGRWSKCYVPAVAMNGAGLRAAHNLIYDHPHCAILFTGNNHRIEFNDIHHVALETGDVGAIYTGRDYSFRGNQIRHNYIHETGGVGMGSMGVYMDDCVSGTEVCGNVFYKAHWAMFIGGGRDHMVKNNLFVACDPAVRADGRGLDAAPVWRNMVQTVMRERLADVPAQLYRQRYPALQSLDRYYGFADGPATAGEQFHGIPPEGNVISRNVCLGKWLDIAWHADPALFDVRENLVIEESPSALTVTEGLRLMGEKQAQELGIATIPFDQIGLRPTPDRQRLDVSR